MMDNKKAATALDEQNAADNLSTVTSIARDASPRQGRKSRKRSGTHVLNANQSVYSLALKCYDEQLVAGGAVNAEGLAARIKAIDPGKYQVLAICHNRDIVTDGIWDVAAEKSHWHIHLRCTDRKSRVKVSTVLNMLGICYRRDIDDALWANRGVETVGDFAAGAMYLTHETPQAVRDGKALYDVSEIISNLTLEEVEQVRAGYIRVSETRRVTQDELVALDKEAHDLGYNLQDFDDWFDALPHSVRWHSKVDKLFKSYGRGIDKRIKKGETIVRLCVYIEGAPNTGKTYAARFALEGKQILNVSGGGTGKFDCLSASTDAIIIDDDVCPNLLRMSDNCICRAYRRQSDNPVWTGQYLVVTSNLPFDEWLEACGITKPDHIKAVKSRFYICHLVDKDGIPMLRPYLFSVSDRGDESAKNERLRLFERFAERFNASIACYHEIKCEDSDFWDRYLESPYTGYADIIDEDVRRFVREEAMREAAEQERKRQEEEARQAELQRIAELKANPPQEPKPFPYERFGAGGMVSGNYGKCVERYERCRYKGICLSHDHCAECDLYCQKRTLTYR